MHCKWEMQNEEDTWESQQFDSHSTPPKTNGICMDLCSSSFICDLPIYRNNPNVSSWSNWWVYPYNAVLLISKQKWTIKTCYSTDEFQINCSVKEARQSTYSMSSFTWSSRKYKLIYSRRKQISGCLKMVLAKTWESLRLQRDPTSPS